MKCVKIFNGKATDKFLTKCGAVGQAHLGFFIYTKCAEFFKKYRKGYLEEVLRHEYTHILQQRELLFIIFYVIYLLNFIIMFIPQLFVELSKKEVYKSWGNFVWALGKAFWGAYLLILFEKEAYRHEDEIEYNKNRKLFSWLRL